MKRIILFLVLLLSLVQCNFFKKFAKQRPHRTIISPPLPGREEEEKASKEREERAKAQRRESEKKRALPPPPPVVVFTALTSRLETIKTALSTVGYINSTLAYLNKSTQLINLPGRNTLTPVTIWKNQNGLTIKMSVVSMNTTAGADEYFFSEGKLFFAEEKQIQYPIAANKILFAISEDQTNTNLQSANFDAVEFRILNFVKAVLSQPSAD